jgi:MFS family permease
LCNYKYNPFTGIFGNRKGLFVRNKLQSLRETYPSQFWLLFFGMLISTTGASMIWPFLMIYVSERMGLSLTISATLMTLNSFMSVLFSFIAGPIVDRVGRKWVMVISLAVNGLGYLLLSHAHTFPMFAFTMSLTGAFNPLYRVGADAMMADLIPSRQRPDAYSMLRMSNNVGVALGPALGGLIAAVSYGTAFYIAAIGMVIYSLLLVFFAKETLSRQEKILKERFAGYDRILKDKAFLSFTGSVTLTTVCAAIMWVLLAVYAKQNFGVMENQYWLIPTTNALMVVFFQVSVTQLTKRFPPLSMLALGAFFYAVGVGSVVLGHSFWAFWISMVIMTIGELILMPTATTYVADLAPADMRGRYMSIYGLTWGISTGLGPVFGGLLNDLSRPAAIWIGAFFFGIASAMAFLTLYRKSFRRVSPSPVG